MKYKFKATLKNIKTGEDERTEEGIFTNWKDAFHYFEKKIYKKIDDQIVKIEMVTKIETIERETFI